VAALLVDVDVVRLADGLHDAGEVLAAVAGRLVGAADDLGPAALRHAVERFDDAWRAGLRLVADEARAAGAQVRAAEARYRAVDASVAAACR
jgi:hypothetical protein